ncbi:MAG: serine hydrolase [Prolixibacteraceae bacterium]|nr:serine hydrolase [Prolixibacteraceae bacterium]
MKRFFILFLMLLCIGLSGFSQSLSSAEIDKLVERTMKTFQVPGMAVALVKDGKVIHSKGYGVSSLKTQSKVDDNTLFGIASNSKAFTSATLAQLVDARKIKWDDKVIQYIPEFRLYNSYVTEDFTIRDLLTHRSGMGLGAGDLMIWPDSANFEIKDIIYNLRFLKQTSPFRTKYDYDNLLYMVAGEVVTRVSGKIWEQVVEDQIMKPLEMNRSAASFARMKDKANVIDGHTVVDGKLQVVPRHDLKTGQCSAGGIYSSISDMSKWMICQLENGKYGSKLDKQIFSALAQREMWSPQTNMPVRSDKYNSHFSAYGLGWGLTDVKGTKQVSHTGGMEGMVTQVTLLPEMKLGIVVLTNQENGAAFSSVTNTIKDAYLGLPNEDWIAFYKERLYKNEKEELELSTKIQSETEKALQVAGNQPESGLFIGEYSDNWLGKVTISERNGKLWFQAVRSPQLKGEMSFYKGNTFAVKWISRSMKADAFVLFSLDPEGKAVGFTMKAISPLTDFSYDFHDLDFKRNEQVNK